MLSFTEATRSSSALASMSAGSDIFGDGVNIAARIESIAAPGGISLSENTWQQVQGKVARPQFRLAGSDNSAAVFTLNSSTIIK